jgi:hypothetical protein
VRPDYVVCLDCGYRGKTLRRHISSRHGLRWDEYRRCWRLRPDHPLTAPAYSEHRSTLAKQLGLGCKSKADGASSADPAVADLDRKVEAKPNPKRTTRFEIEVRRHGRSGLGADEGEAGATALPHHNLNRSRRPRLTFDREPE